MPDSILIAATKKFNDVLDIALQQTSSKLFDKVNTKSGYVGESASVVDTLNAFALNRVSGVGKPVVPDSYGFDRRWIAPDMFTKYFLRDTFAALESSINPTSALTRGLVAAANRAKDDSIISAFFGDALTGKNGSTVTTWASEGSGQVVNQNVGGTASGLNVEKLKAARGILLKNDIDLDSTPVYIAYNAEADKDLLAEAQVISKEYAEKAVLKDGKIEYFMGFYFVHTERLLTDGTYRRIPVWTKDSIHFGTWMEPRVRIDERVDLEGHPIQIGLEAMWNATRTEPKGIVEIKIAE